MLLLDTHVLLWLEGAPYQLGRQTTTALVEGQVNWTLAVSSISFWEIGLLQEKRRLHVSEDLEGWRERCLDNDLTEVAPDGATALLATRLRDLHADPADRFILATALLWEAALVTADRQLLAWPGKLRRLDARL